MLQRHAKISVLGVNLALDARVKFVKNAEGIVTHAVHRQRGEFEAPKVN